MAAPTNILHIQGREENPPKIVRIDGPSVRVGRGRSCEVRLDESRLAEVQCILRRETDGWRIQPVGPSGMLSIYGEPIGRTRHLDVNTPLRVGDFWLTLREPASEPTGDFDDPIVVEAEPFSLLERDEPSPLDILDPQPVARSAEVPVAEAKVLRAIEPQAPPTATDLPVRERPDEREWEARWRAVGERLKRSSHLRTSSQIPPMARPIPRPSTSPSVPRIPMVEEASGSRRLGETTRSEAAAPTPRTSRLLRTSIERERGFAASPLPDRGPSRRAEPPAHTSFHGAVPEPACPVEPIREAESPSRAFEEFSAFVEAGVGPNVVDAAHPRSGESSSHSSTIGMEPWEAPEPFQPPSESAVAVENPPADPQPQVSRPAATRPASAQLPPDVRVDRPGSHRFPTASAILEAQRTRVVETLQTPRKRNSGPKPTEYRTPEQWSAPFWLAMLPALALILGGGGACLALTVCWTVDNQLARTAYAAVTRVGNDSGASLDPAVRPKESWYFTTAGHLAAWARAVERSENGPGSREEVASLLDAARHIAPLDPATRLGLARIAPTDDSAKLAKLGLSRDSASLTVAADSLRRQGKKADAIRLFRAALVLAFQEPRDESAPPAFDDDPKVRRYRLAGEVAVQGILVEIAKSD